MCPHAFTTQVVTAADVCLLGLNIIMPLMSAELLKFPNLCLQVSKKFKLIPIKLIQLLLLVLQDHHLCLRDISREDNISGPGASGET